MPHRADIVDRNGVMLATSVARPQLFADPRAVREPVETAATLARLLDGADAAELARRLSDPARRFVWLSRRLTAEQHDAIAALALPGLGFRDEERRVHPYGALFNDVLGMTDVDGFGVSGLEWGHGATRRLAAPLRTSLDVRVQAATAASVQAAMTQTNAAGTAAIVMNMGGEILGMVSLPNSDPTSRDAFLQRASASVYELGDLSRLFIAALQLSVPGAAQSTFVSPHGMGARLGLLQQATMPVEIGMPLINAHPLHRAFEIGKDIAATPVQVAAAIAALINGGEYHEPTLVMPDTRRATPSRQIVLLPEMSATLRQQLGDGMTGVAPKVIDGAYSPDHLVATAVAAFPVTAPRFLVYVLLDDPKPTDAAASRAVALKAATEVGVSVEKLSTEPAP